MDAHVYLSLPHLDPSKQIAMFKSALRGNASLGDIWEPYPNHIWQVSSLKKTAMHAEILYVHQIKKFNVGFFPQLVLNHVYENVSSTQDMLFFGKSTIRSNWLCNKWTPLNSAKAGGWNPSCLTPRRWWLKFETSWKETCFCKPSSVPMLLFSSLCQGVFNLETTSIWVGRNLLTTRNYCFGARHLTQKMIENFVSAP